MPEESGSRDGPRGKTAARDEKAVRKDRLAQALKRNLRRRKEQARARKDRTGDGDTD